jgi:hypothetical protein
MTVRELLAANKSRILRKWLDLVFDTYPAETARFLKDEKDRFANPVAYTVRCNLELLLDDMINKTRDETVLPHIEEIVRIRAVQDFSPSQAVAFVGLVKGPIIDEMKRQAATKEMYLEWIQFEGVIDGLSAIALNAYSACRDSINQIRVKELKAENSALMKMLGI